MLFSWVEMLIFYLNVYIFENIFQEFHNKINNFFYLDLHKIDKLLFKFKIYIINLYKLNHTHKFNYKFLILKIDM